MKYICLIIMLALNYGVILNAQSLRTDYTMPSPTAASLGKFGVIPVSHFTGLPLIEIPIYTLHEKNITVPISLTYHASGIKPDEHPGWVGLNWNLNAGGAITRVVKDLPPFGLGCA